MRRRRRRTSGARGGYVGAYAEGFGHSFFFDLAALVLARSLPRALIGLSRQYADGLAALRRPRGAGVQFLTLSCTAACSYARSNLMLCLLAAGMLAGEALLLAALPLLVLRGGSMLLG